MSLAAKIKIIYPAAIPEVDFFLRDDGIGAGAYIDRWMYAQPRPTQLQLDGVAAAAAAVIAQLAADNQAQQASMIQARNAFAAMQTIIDNADTAATAQLRVGMKQMAQVLQHLIKALVR